MKKGLSAVKIYAFLALILVYLPGKTGIAYGMSGERYGHISEGEYALLKYGDRLYTPDGDSGDDKSLWEKAREILLDIWENAGKEEAEEEQEDDRIFINQQQKARIFLIVVVVAVGLLLLFLIISFLRSSWKEKLHSIVVLILAIAIVVGLVLLGLHLSKDSGPQIGTDTQDQISVDAEEGVACCV